MMEKSEKKEGKGVLLIWKSVAVKSYDSQGPFGKQEVRNK
jgi:hypothetical protein